MGRIGPIKLGVGEVVQEVKIWPGGEFHLGESTLCGNKCVNGNE